MNPFYDHTRVFYNTARQSDTENQTRAVRPEMLSDLRLGSLIPYPLYNQYREMYGTPLNLKLPIEALRPPIEADTAFWSEYPIPYTINETKNKLVDVAGTVYLNDSLPVKPRRL